MKMKKFIFLFISFLLTSTYGYAKKNAELLDLKEAHTFPVLSTRSDDGIDNTAKPTLTEVITEVEGRNQEYLRYGAGYFPYMGYVVYYDENSFDPSPASIVFGSDNDIYFYDIMDFGWDGYAKGTISGNKVTMSLPQTIFEESYSWTEEPYYQNLCVMTQIGEGEDMIFRVDPDITQVTYTINSANQIVLDPLPEGKALGVVTYFQGKDYETPEDEAEGNDNYTITWFGAWSGAADFQQRFEPFGQGMVKIPEGAEILTYQVVVNGYNYPVNVAIEDDAMYIEGFGDSPYTSNFVIKAQIDGNTAYIPQNQYIGIFSLDNEMITVKCGYQVGNKIIYESDETSFQFMIDESRKTLVPKDPDMYLCYAYLMQTDPSTGQNGLLFYLYFKNFVIMQRDSYAGIPSDPFNLWYSTEFREEYGYNSIHFEFLSFSTEGNIVLTGNMYYSIYIDGELEVFEYVPPTETESGFAHYSMLDGPTSQIPFLFTNTNEFDIWDEIEREVGFYYDGVTTVGVEMIYKYNDMTTASNIVTLNVETGEVETSPSAVSSIYESPILKTEFFDLNGRRVVNPSHGIFVKRTTFADGSVKSRKVIFK